MVLLHAADRKESVVDPAVPVAVIDAVERQPEVFGDVRERRAVLRQPCVVGQGRDRLREVRVGPDPGLTLRRLDVRLDGQGGDRTALHDPEPVAVEGPLDVDGPGVVGRDRGDLGCDRGRLDGGQDRRARRVEEFGDTARVGHPTFGADGTVHQLIAQPGNRLDDDLVGAGDGIGRERDACASGRHHALHDDGHAGVTVAVVGAVGRRSRRGRRRPARLDGGEHRLQVLNVEHRGVLAGVGRVVSVLGDGGGPDRHRRVQSGQRRREGVANPRHVGDRRRDDESRGHRSTGREQPAELLALAADQAHIESACCRKRDDRVDRGRSLRCGGVGHESSSRSCWAASRSTRSAHTAAPAASWSSRGMAPSVSVSQDTDPPSSRMRPAIWR